MYKRAAVTLALTATIAVGACGGGSSHLSKKDFVKKADAICAAGQKKTDALKAPDFDPSADNLTAAQLTQVADYLDKGVAIQSSSNADLKKLNPPAADESTIKSMLSLVDKADGQLSDAASAARKNDGAKYRSGIQTATETFDSASAKAKAYGLTTCGQN